MYSLKNYLKRGTRFVNNNLFSGRKKLSTLMLYSTDLCDSKCKHCLIWAKRPPTHLPLQKIMEIMQSKCIDKGTLIGLEGGEFLLHPEALDIMKWLNENHPYFDLLSNGLKPEKTIHAVLKYPPTRLYMSFDGNKETYKYMRGKDGHDQVLEVIQSLHKKVPISLMFTLTPYNSFSDLEYVAGIAKKYDIDMRVGIYSDIAFFDTLDKAHETEIGSRQNKENLSFSEVEKIKNLKKTIIPDTSNTSICNPQHDTSKIKDSYIREEIPSVIKDFKENFDFVALYDEWRRNKLKLKCYSIRDSLVLLPNGDVPLCQNLELKIGNVYQKPLDEIFNGKETRIIHKQYVHNCNQCWVNFHRKYDVVLYRSLEKALPKPIIEFLLGKYSWNGDPKMTYSRYFRKKV
jgi:MoaA/NifB/PqqE/SkfB family radical SAM enzyme